ncbi:two-component sensor histidine kinase [Actinocatenispora thailandica]|uniref:histidine kinase n=1 Tax=Actinocatenispora thailandica TaxID=227318 RepID=A0A7R7DWE5_9ACTN|nr:two-component sensor histidine kinase [Actinocatenispora thailandica]
MAAAVPPGSGTPGARVGARGRPGRHGIVARSMLVTCAVAVISVLVTAAVAVPLARAAGTRAERRGLGQQADVVAALVANRTGRPVRTAMLVRRLRAAGVDLAVVTDGTADRAWVPPRVARRVARGDAVDASTRRGGRRLLLAGRATGAGAGVVLAQPVPRLLPAAAVPPVGLALVAGLIAGLLAGVLLARRLSGPIRRAAGAARRMSAGDRSVRLPVEDPAEVAELSSALNQLAGALADSEGRQREFLLSVSHELRTPLTAIRGYGEALADGVLPDDAAVRSAGATVLAESARLDRLVTDLLALARLAAQDFPIELVDVDLVELVAAAATAWAPRCRTTGLVLRTEVPAGLVRVRTDPGRLRQVLDGLVENALRVVPAGGPVVLAVRTEGGRRCWRCATAGRACPTTTSRPPSSGAGCTASTAVSGRSAPGWGWRSRRGWCPGWAAGSSPAMPPRAAPPSP